MCEEDPLSKVSIQEISFQRRKYTCKSLDFLLRKSLKYDTWDDKYWFMNENT